MLSRSAQAIPLPDTGTTRGDLLAILHAVIAYITSPNGREVLHAALLPVDDGYTNARHAFWSGRLAALCPVVQRGIDRGELRADTDAQLLLETLVAPLHGRLLLTGEPVDGDLAERIVDMVLDGAVNPESR